MAIKKEEDTASFETQTVRVKKRDLSKILTCSVCNNFFKDPVNITECLHIFCKECISKKITEDDLNTCPVCDVYLGCMPLEKIRPDKTWSSISTALAPLSGQATIKDEHAEYKQIKQLKEEAEQSTPLHLKRKERSLTSLVNEVKSEPNNSIGRRQEGNGGKVVPSQGSAMPISNPRKPVEERSEGSNFSMNLNHSDQSDGQSFKQQQILPKDRRRSQKIEKRVELVKNLLKRLDDDMEE